jgi:hypothetical protein
VVSIESITVVSSMAVGAIGWRIRLMETIGRLSGVPYVSLWHTWRHFNTHCSIPFELSYVLPIFMGISCTMLLVSLTTTSMGCRTVGQKPSISGFIISSWTLSGLLSQHVSA